MNWQEEQLGNIILRYGKNGNLDEAVLHAGNDCVMHLEQTDKGCVQVRLYGSEKDVAILIQSDRSLRVVRGWEEDKKE